MMRASECTANLSVAAGNPRSECVYRSLTVVAMFLLLASLWAF